MAPGGAAVTGAFAGLILSVDASGNEKLRVSIDPSLGAAPTAAPSAIPIGPGFGGGGGFGVSTFPSIDMRPSPPVVVDADGRVAFVRANGRAGVISADGNMTLASERVCGRPISLQPAGSKKFVIACEEGTVAMYSD